MYQIMSEDIGSSRHVAYEQVQSIIDFMGQHVEFATGNLRSLEARHTSKRLWGELTKTLNNCRTGTRKSSDGWSKDHHPPEVKLEDCHENASNEYCNVKSDCSDRQSDCDRESIESGDSNDDFNDDSDINPNEPLIQSLYPKWLIKVEKKRAEAELIRARAEEKRADVAARSADAMTIQAEALRKLADAALSQANAVSKIATLLENRHGDILTI